MGQRPTYPTITSCNFDEEFKIPETPFLQQYPFRPQAPDQDRPPSQSSLIDIDEYDPERPSLGFQTPNNAPSRSWQSGFATIPEESSVTSQRTIRARSSTYDDSPPVSPKSMAPPRSKLEDRSAYNLRIYATAIPEETPESIDPAILSKDAFAVLNSAIGDTNGSNLNTANSSHSSLAIEIPATPGSARSMFEPLLAAAFPSSSPMATGNESPILGHTFSETSSLYSSPSPSPSISLTSSPIQLPSPVIRCSPRPPHAHLPNTSLSINFAELPKLAPSPRGPRGSPPKLLRTSIAALRQMNSDASDAKKEKAGKGETRYLRLGREDSVQLHGDESWLDEIEDHIELDQSCQQAGRSAA